MPDPIVDAFVTGYARLETEEEQDEYARRAIQSIEASTSPVDSFGKIVAVGNAVNRDFTGLMSTFQRQSIPAVPLPEVLERVEAARDQAP